MSNILQCIVVEDEPSAQNILKKYIDDTPNLELAALFDNALEARTYLQDSDQQVDLMLLDINLPKLSGISFLKSLADPPMVILTTAYDEYALEGYELEVTDYLLKPFSFERFLKAISKVEKRLEKEDITSNRSIIIKSNKKTYSLNPDDILYVEALGDYVTVHTAEERYTTYQTLKNMEKLLPRDRFIRVHKSYIIALDKIDYLEGNRFFIREQEIPIGSTYREQVKERFSS